MRDGGGGGCFIEPDCPGAVKEQPTLLFRRIETAESFRNPLGDSFLIEIADFRSHRCCDLRQWLRTID